jgi:hypothetical protein
VGRAETEPGSINGVRGYSAEQSPNAVVITGSELSSEPGSLVSGGCLRK